jgi:hypothetical protein
MFMTLATLAVVSLIAIAMVRGAMIARRSLRGEHALRQVDRILDAAEARAAAALKVGQPADDTIELRPADLGGEGTARVTVTTSARDTRGLLVQIVVEYPCEGPVTVRRTRELAIPIQASTLTDPEIDKEP